MKRRPNFFLLLLERQAGLCLPAVLFALLVLIAATGCSHQTVRTPLAGNVARDNSFHDLTAGSGLRILIPILKPGDYQLGSTSGQKGNTIVLSAPNLAGYEFSHYVVKGRSDGAVRLRFAWAEVTKDGHTTRASNEPILPFQLPTRRQHVRLLYLVRQSQSDHNMAILASKGLSELNSFTERVKNDAALCKNDGEVFCSWVPSGFAVRAE